MCFLISWGKVAFSICVDEPELKLIFYLFSQRMETLCYAEISQGFSHNFNSSITLFWKSVIRFLNCNKVFFSNFFMVQRSLWCKKAKRISPLGLHIGFSQSFNMRKFIVSCQWEFNVTNPERLQHFKKMVLAEHS